MSTVEALEERMAVLEAEVAQLKQNAGQAVVEPRPDWWNAIAGIFADDPAYEEAMRLGREWREAQRPKPAKPRKPNRPGTK